MNLKRIGAIDVLRGLAAFFIIGNHLCLSPAQETARGLLHYCNMFVGIFAAVSGYFLALSFKANPCSYEVWAKRAKRILLPYFLWTIVYLGASQLFGIIAGDGLRLDRLMDPYYLFTAIFFGNSSAHLWFLSGLFYAVTVFCIVCHYFPVLAIKSLPWWIVSGVLLACSIMTDGRYSLYEARLFAFFAMGYAFAVGKKDVSGRRPCFLLILLALALTGHFFLDEIHQFVRDYIVAVLVLALVTHDAPLLRCSNRVTKALGEYSMGIYLVHPLFCAGLGVVAKKVFVQPYGPVAILLDWLVVFALSIVLVWVLRKIPYVGRSVL